MTAPTPSDAEVRGRYCDGVYLQTGHRTEGEDFDRWLTRHDAEIRRAAEQQQQEADPLDEDDHRPRHDRFGGHWKWRRADLWCDGACRCIDGAWKLPELAGLFGPLTFCDCP